MEKERKHLRLHAVVALLLTCVLCAGLFSCSDTGRRRFWVYHRVTRQGVADAYVELRADSKTSPVVAEGITDRRGYVSFQPPREMIQRPFRFWFVTVRADGYATASLAGAHFARPAHVTIIPMDLTYDTSASRATVRPQK